MTDPWISSTYTWINIPGEIDKIETHVFEVNRVFTGDSDLRELHECLAWLYTNYGEETPEIMLPNERDTHGWYPRVTKESKSSMRLWNGELTEGFSYRNMYYAQILMTPNVFAVFKLVHKTKPK